MSYHTRMSIFAQLYLRCFVVGVTQTNATPTEVVYGLIIRVLICHNISAMTDCGSIHLLQSMILLVFARFRGGTPQSLADRAPRASATIHPARHRCSAGGHAAWESGRPRLRQADFRQASRRDRRLPQFVTWPVLPRE